MEDYLKNKIEKLADKPGVYFFKNAAETVIYVGKAKNLKKRVKNHFQKPDQHAFDFIVQVTDIDFILAASETEALILEQQFIKKLQPRWNTEWKDDKNYAFIALSIDDFPRVHITHQPKKSDEVVFGPFVKGKEVKYFLREIRKALPYRTCRNLPKKSCFNQHLGLCLAPCQSRSRLSPAAAKDIYKITKSSYGILIGALISLIKAYLGVSQRIECYDISNLSGTLAVGSMAVFENGRANKNEYRKFKINTVAGQNDVASLKEILRRRLEHSEWPLPDLIVLDGGKGQLKAARGIKIPVVALAKIGKSDGKLFSSFSKSYAQLSKLPQNLSNQFLQIRDEAHRFAITYNKLRREMILNKISQKIKYGS